MISRFHTLIELACRASDGRVELIEFSQGRALKTDVTAPAPRFDRETGIWSETDTETRLPAWPDAFFTLRVKGRPPADDLHFLYEADLKTASSPAFARKLRAVHQFIVRQKDQQHIERHSGVSRIRAVLTETLDVKWAEHLRQTAGSSYVAPKPSVLFWFVPSTLFTQSVTIADGAHTREAPRYVAHPSIAFSRIWGTPVDDELRSLFD